MSAPNVEQSARKRQKAPRFVVVSRWNQKKRKPIAVVRFQRTGTVDERAYVVGPFICGRVWEATRKDDFATIGFTMPLRGDQPEHPTV